MTLAVTSETGKHERNWKNLCFLLCTCAVAAGFLFVSLRNGQTIVQFLTGAVWGLGIGEVFNIVFRGNA
jgi:hypothetical protein